MASEARISLEFDIRDLTTAGKNAKPVAGSLQIASAGEAFPESTSSRPIVARGARRRVNPGFRRSQSSKITRALACAARRANAVEVVDLPSSGMADVNPTILLVLTARFKSRASLIARISPA